MRSDIKTAERKREYATHIPWRKTYQSSSLITVHRLTIVWLTKVYVITWSSVDLGAIEGVLLR
jgi:hypothetical protein